MINLLVCVATNLFRIYLIRRFIQIFCPDTQIEKKKELLFYSGFFFLNTGLYWIFHLTWINLISNILGIGMLVYLNTKSLKKILFVTSAIYVINMGCDIITVTVFVNYQSGKDFNQLYEIITCLLFLVCALLTERIINYQTKSDTVQNLPLLLVPISSIIMLDFLIRDKAYTHITVVAAAIGFLFINFLVFYLYNMLVKSVSQKYENDMMRKELQAYSNQMKIILQTEEKVKTLRHDMKHHMNELKLLAIKKDTDGIQHYINSMEEFIQNQNEIIASGNLEIDSILNFLLQRAKKQLQNVTVKVKLPENLRHSFDINIIIGNLLENAIEAAIQTEEKTLDVLIEFKQGVLKVEIKNSFIGEIKKNQKGFITTKERKESHGIGLQSVKKIVEKYNGVLTISTLENIFYVKLIIYLMEDGVHW